MAREDPDVLVGRRPVLELLRSGRGAQRVLIAKGLARSDVIGEIRRRADKANIPVRVVPRAEIDRLSEGQNHQGVAAESSRFRYTPLAELLSHKTSLLFLDGVTDPQNLGSLLRTVECAGFGGVVIPAHRASGVTAAVRRVSAGAAEVVPVARVGNLAPALDEAREAGLWSVGLEPDADEDLWGSQLMDPPVALVLGSEGKGLRPGVRQRIDGFVRIPRFGRVASLNVAVAGAVAMFEIARRVGSSSDTL